MQAAAAYQAGATLTDGKGPIAWDKYQQITIGVTEPLVDFIYQIDLSCQWNTGQRYPYLHCLVSNLDR